MLSAAVVLGDRTVQGESCISVARQLLPDVAWYSVNNNSNNDNREFIEHFQRPKALYNTKKNMQRVNTRTQINGIKRHC